MMLEETRLKLEANGIRVIDTPFDFHYKTRTFVQLPDGRTLAHYDYLHDIPETLYNGEEISLGETAIPPGETIYTDETRANASGGWIWDGDNPVWGRQELVIPAGVVALIIFLIKVVAIFIVLYVLMDKFMAPCGPRGYVEEVDDCVKMVIAPDCSSITIDSCKTDEEGNPAPEVIGRSGPPGLEWAELVKWAVVGIVAIGGVVVAVKVLPEYLEKKKLEAK